MSTDQNTKKKEILSTQGYRGTRDFFPEDQRMRNFVYSKFHSTLHSFGFEEYDGPFLEHLELYASKSSEEIVREQLYSFVDKGNRTLAIRPEMTPTLARMIASKQRELQRPIRWYSIPTCMRFERPQRGRLREFDQLNVDIFGGIPLDEDIEILLTCVEIFKQIGAHLSDFTIKVNHRDIMNNYLFKVLLLSESLRTPLFRLIDKKDKITSEEFKFECEKLSITNEIIIKLENFLSSSLDEVIEQLGEFAKPAHEIRDRVSILNEITQGNSVQFCSSIMRGFDYYTGIIFEVFDNHKENRRAIFGGGRYDNLVGAFGGQELPGVGFGLGDVPFLNFMEVHNLLPTLKKETDVCVLRFTENDRMTALKLSQNLRNCGLNVESPITNSKFGKQIQAAEKSGCLAVVFQGETELSESTFAVKWLQTGIQETFSNNQEGILKFSEKFYSIKNKTNSL